MRKIKRFINGPNSNHFACIGGLLGICIHFLPVVWAETIIFCGLILVIGVVGGVLLVIAKRLTP